MILVLSISITYKTLLVIFFSFCSFVFSVLAMKLMLSFPLI